MLKNLVKNAHWLIISLAITVFGVSLFNGFVWDDEEQVVNNQAVHSLANLPSVWVGSTFNSAGATSMGGMYYKPLMMTSFSLIYSIFGETAWAFHLFQLSIHIASTYLLYRFLASLLKNRPISLFASLVFLVHPLAVETVVYVSALQDTLSFFFTILALHFTTRTRGPVPYIFPTIFSLLAILSKETGVLSFILVSLYYLIYKRQYLLRSLFASILALLLYLYLRLGLAGIGISTHGLTAISRMSFAERLISIPMILWHYLGRFFLPFVLTIAEHWVITSISLTQFWLPLVGSLLVFTLLIWGYQNKPTRNYLFFLLWFILALGLHLQLYPLDMTVADRWFYFPLAGLLGTIASYATSKIAFLKKNKNLILQVIITIIIAFSLRSFTRVINWKDGLTLYSHDYQFNRSAFDLTNNLAVELFRAGSKNQASLLFKESIKLAPHWWTSYNNLGAYYQDVGELGRAEELYRISIQNGQYYLAYENLAIILYQQQKWDELEEFLFTALTVFPNNQLFLDLLNL